MNVPLCFVIMPFGKKPSIAGSMVDFDSIYEDLISPAINEAQLEPLRADNEMTGGIIHKPMFERLILCEYAVADLTTANANVFYELGVRHAVRSWSTVLLFAKESGQLPFDVGPLRAMPYQLTIEGKTADVETTKIELVKRLREAKEAQNSAIDSPIFQLVEGFPEIDHIKTDIFRDRVQYSTIIKEQIAAARNEGKEALSNLVNQLADIKDLESGVVIDLFLSYRAVNGWPEMISLVQKMSPTLANTVVVQEQLALALDRDGKGEEAEKVLLDLIKKHGPSSETYRTLGRIYKDMWEVAYKNGNELLAAGLLDQAIEAYVHGFEADWSDFYPGINAVKLMQIRQPPDRRLKQLIPVVEYAVNRRIAAGKPEYWDYAARLELAVLAKDKEAAMKSVSSALALLREPWEAETTTRNLQLIHEVMERRQDTVEWIKQIEQALEKRSVQLRPEFAKMHYWKRIQDQLSKSQT